MTLLKRIKVPLYYLKKRKDKQISLELFDTTIYIKPDDLHLVDIETKDTKQPKQKKERKSRKPGEYSVRICFENKSLTKSEKTEIHSIISDALLTKKAHIFFHDLLVNAMEIADDNDTSLKQTLHSLKQSKQLYHFSHRSSSKSSVLYSIIPDANIPRSYANKEMLENFMYNVTISELSLSMIKGIKSVTARLG